MTNKEIKAIWKRLIDAFTLIDDAEMNEREHMSLPMIRTVINEEFQDILKKICIKINKSPLQVRFIVV